MSPSSAKTIYLDHAATTPLDPAVLEAMRPYLTAEYGNPSSIHQMGQHARMAVDRARERVAEAIGAHRMEIVFTSGGTESDNAAIRGAVFAVQDRGRHIVTTSIEHEAVIETCRSLAARHGFEVTFLEPGPDGRVTVESFERAIRPDTTLVSVMYANNEIGAIQPIAELGRLCRVRGITFHVDAVQAVGALPVDVDRDQIDLMSLSGHKFYGPKGVGALYVRRKTPWSPQQMGGGQERQRRSGTENVAGIVGLAEALERSVEKLDEAPVRLCEMREYVFDTLTRALPTTVVNGCRTNRLPNNVNVSFPGVTGESLVMALDGEGVMISSGSACSSGSTEPSHVLRAIGSPPDVARCGVRLTLGRENSWDEIRTAAECMVSTVRRLQSVATVAAAAR
jgi:cysteine desulfurase